MPVHEKHRELTTANGLFCQNGNIFLGECCPVCSRQVCERHLCARSALGIGWDDVGHLLFSSFQTEVFFLHLVVSESSAGLRFISASRNLRQAVVLRQKYAVRLQKWGSSHSLVGGSMFYSRWMEVRAFQLIQSICGCYVLANRDRTKTLCCLLESCRCLKCIHGSQKKW